MAIHNVERKVLFVLNPISGGINKEQFKTQLHTICVESDLVFTIFETTGTDDRQKILTKIEQFQPTIVVACGGDGTINLVGQAMLGNGIPMGIIPLGSANGLATELLISNKLEENVNLLFTGKTIQMNVLQVNREHFCLHLADVGFNAKLVQEYDEAPGRGKLTYLWSFLKTIWKKEGVRSQIRLNNRQLRQRTEMITFANARKYGTGALINPNGKLDDDRFEVCIFQPYPRWQLPHLTWLFFAGRLHHSRYVDIVSTKTVTVSLARPQPLQVDGEVVGEVTEVSVEMLAEKLPVVVPRGYDAG
jgi:diacylglycerol kinase family enzyme